MTSPRITRYRVYETWLRGNEEKVLTCGIYWDRAYIDSTWQLLMFEAPGRANPEWSRIPSNWIVV